MPEKIESESVYYVYVLFDWNGLPFYVGAGTGSRWYANGSKTAQETSKQTITILGEVPKIKFREGLSEEEAFSVESLLIKTIGRRPNGPLVNRTDNRSGMDSETALRIAENVSVEQRKEIARQGGRANVKLRLSTFFHHIQCPHCGKEGSIPLMRRWHLDKCPSLTGNDNREYVQCPYCGKEGRSAPMHRWHFENCRHKTS